MLPVFLFVLPAWPEGDDWQAYSGAAAVAHDRLLERFRSLGFETLDLLPRLRGVDPATLRAAPDDPWHPNADGHDWIAGELAEWLGRLLVRRG